MDRSKLLVALKDVFLEIIREPDIQGEIQNLLGEQCSTSHCNTANDGANFANSHLGSLIASVNNHNTSAVLDKIETIISMLDSLEKKIPNDESKLANDIVCAIEYKIYEIQNGEVEKIKNICQKLEQDKLSLKNEIELLTKEKNILEKNCSETQKRFEPFSELFNVWEELNQLDDYSKSYLGSLCGSFDLYACLSLGRDSGKLNQLWQFIKENALGVEKEPTCVVILNDYFEFCIKVANSHKSNEDQYSFFDIELGSDYDFEKCIKTSNSKQVGVVKRLVSKGVKIRDKIVYQAIVEIG